VALKLLDNVFLLHLALEAAQRIFEGFSPLNSDFRQTNYTPKLVPLDRIVIATFRRQVKGESQRAHCKELFTTSPGAGG